MLLACNQVLIKDETQQERRFTLVSKIDYQNRRFVLLCCERLKAYLILEEVNIFGIEFYENIKENKLFSHIIDLFEPIMKYCKFYKNMYYMPN